MKSFLISFLGLVLVLLALALVCRAAEGAVAPAARAAPVGRIIDPL